MAMSTQTKTEAILNKIKIGLAEDKSLAGLIDEAFDEQEITDPAEKAQILQAVKETYPGHAKELKSKNPFLIKSLAGFDSYLKNYNEANNYTCRIFPKSDFENLVFAPANIGFIGARTSRGKTTALVSVAMDALEQNKKVFFATMEESPIQIALRFMSHILYNGGYYPEQDKAILTADTWQAQLQNTKFNTKRTILKILRGESIGDIFNDSTMTKKFIENVHFAKQRLNDYLTNENLILYNGLEAPNFEHMIETMGDNDAGTIVLLDYVQKVKPPKQFNDISNRFALLQYASGQLASMAKKSNVILISGAQFGRTGEKQKSTELDLFNDESFQECSAIEQAGEIEIGIGRHFRHGVKHSYYAILKDRDNGEYNPSIYYELTDLAKFSKFAPARRETDKGGIKYKNLVEYYNQDTDTIDGETKEERNARVYGGKRGGKQGGKAKSEAPAPQKSTNEKVEIKHGTPILI